MSLYSYYNNMRFGLKLMVDLCKYRQSTNLSVFANSTIVRRHFGPLKTDISSVQTRSYCEEKSPDEAEDKSKKIVDASKDRSKVIPVEVSVKYLQSSAYRTTYGDDPVWRHYRRNHKGQIPPRKTRKRCIRQDMITTGNPCPICRDEYLVLHPNNIELLKQFISPDTGAVISYQKTGLCQRRHKELLVAIMQAKDLGLISFDLPFQKYDYSEYLDANKAQQ